LRKNLVFMNKLDRITMEQFIDYYENHHVPLIRQLLPSISEYRRNYLRKEDLAVSVDRTQMPVPSYDVVTEIFFETDADYEQFKREIGDKETIRRIREDELNFLDHTKTSNLSVEEHISRK
jgi:hypothetical protein